MAGLGETCGSDANLRRLVGRGRADGKGGAGKGQADGGRDVVGRGGSGSKVGRIISSASFVLFYLNLIWFECVRSPHPPLTPPALLSLQPSSLLQLSSSTLSYSTVLLLPLLLLPRSSPPLTPPPSNLPPTNPRIFLRLLHPPTLSLHFSRCPPILHPPPLFPKPPHAHLLFPLSSFTRTPFPPSPNPSDP